MRHSLSDESTRAASVLGAWCDLPGAVPRDEIVAIFKDKGKQPKNNNVFALDRMYTYPSISLDISICWLYPQVPMSTYKYL